MEVSTKQPYLAAGLYFSLEQGSNYSCADSWAVGPESQSQGLLSSDLVSQARAHLVLFLLPLWCRLQTSLCLPNPWFHLKHKKTPYLTGFATGFNDLSHMQYHAEGRHSTRAPTASLLCPGIYLGRSIWYCNHRNLRVTNLVNQHLETPVFHQCRKGCLRQKCWILCSG